MADFYYEISDASVEAWNGKYFVKHSRSGDAMMAGGFAITVVADRIWKESGDKVSFVKHRHCDPAEAKVDMKEFMWIKLKSETLSG